MVTRRLALKWRKRRAIEASPVSFAASSRYSLIPGHVDVGNEIVRIGTLEHEHLDGVVGLGPLNEGDQIADQFGPQKIHGRGRNFREQNGPFLAHGQCLENHGISSALVIDCLVFRRIHSCGHVDNEERRDDGQKREECRSCFHLG